MLAARQGRPWLLRRALALDAVVAPSPRNHQYNNASMQRGWSSLRSPVSATNACPSILLRALPQQRSWSSRPTTAPTHDTKKGAPKSNPILAYRGTGHWANLHRQATPITMMTAHDYPSAQFCERAGMDTVLVGDSLAMVALGHPSTNQITMDEMLHHCRAVARGAQTPFLVGDMPFGSYQVSADAAVRNAVRFLQEGNMEAVKLEGGVTQAKTIQRIVEAGIPVLGHIGLTPQSQSALGGYRVQGKTAQSALQLVHDARALQQAGCFAIVLEAIPAPLATYLSTHVLTDIPTIGIGAGAGCGGQVLVQNDMLGIFDRFVPRFCKQYAHLNAVVVAALEEYAREVKARSFPDPAVHTYPMDDAEWQKFMELVGKSVTTPDSSGTTPAETK